MIDGYKRDKKNPGMFLPCKRISESALRWSNDEIRNFSEYCDSPTFIKGLEKYNEVVRSTRKGKKE